MLKRSRATVLLPALRCIAGLPAYARVQYAGRGNDGADARPNRDADNVGKELAIVAERCGERTSIERFLVREK